MNLVDSSGWLEYFGDGPSAQAFSEPIQTLGELIVSSINLFEVFERVYQQRNEEAALQAVALMQQASVVPVDEELATTAAKLSAVERLPLADAIILATARRAGALLWTQDADFRGLAGVRYVPKTA